MSTSDPRSWVPPRWLVYGLILGLYLSLRGYQSRDGDQAYRLPLLLHQQDPSLFADDPFVRAFDVFNPHRGALALLDGVSRVLGLSAALFFLWCLTFLVTVRAVDRLARCVWPKAGSRVAIVAIALFLIAHGGNVGTNHLFEPMLLDRLVAFALGWLAFAAVVDCPERGWWKAALAVAAAGLVHPSVGLQLMLVLASTWVGWGIVSQTRWPLVARALLALAVAVVPGALMNLGQGRRLLEGLPTAEFRLLSVEVQGPQHMLPHLWRGQQWLAWGCYPILAVMALWDRRSAGNENSAGFAAAQEPGRSSRLTDPSFSGVPSARSRLAVLLVVILIGLGIGWIAVERLHDLRVTLFQPFRMATVARGVSLVALAGRVLALWRRGDVVGRGRAALLTAGLAGDWALVVATLVEIGVAVVESTRFRWYGSALVGGGILLFGLRFLGSHDTESGHIPLMVAMAVAIACTLAGGQATFAWTRARFAGMLCAAWLIPGAALFLELGPVGESVVSQRWARALVEKCRFVEVPTDDMERLAAWCRDHTPPSARFVGPPGPKTFRLWSHRSLAFNRSGSPYHAAGLADWSARFRDHVGFRGPAEAFARAYLNDRHRLERGFDEMTDAQRAALAERNGATFVIARTPPHGTTRELPGPLRLLHVEGRYAVYSVNPSVRVAERRNAHD